MADTSRARERRPPTPLVDSDGQPIDMSFFGGKYSVMISVSVPAENLAARIPLETSADVEVNEAKASRIIKQLTAPKVEGAVEKFLTGYVISRKGATIKQALRERKGVTILGGLFGKKSAPAEEQAPQEPTLQNLVILLDQRDLLHELRYNVPIEIAKASYPVLYSWFPQTVVEKATLEGAIKAEQGLCAQNAREGDALCARVEKTQMFNLKYNFLLESYEGRDILTKYFEHADSGFHASLVGPDGKVVKTWYWSRFDEVDGGVVAREQAALQEEGAAAEASE